MEEEVGPLSRRFEGSINQLERDKLLAGREISDSMFRMTEAATVP